MKFAFISISFSSGFPVSHRCHIFHINEKWILETSKLVYKANFANYIATISIHRNFNQFYLSLAQDYANRAFSENWYQHASATECTTWRQMTNPTVVIRTRTTQPEFGWFEAGGRGILIAMYCLCLSSTKTVHVMAAIEGWRCYSTLQVPWRAETSHHDACWTVEIRTLHLLVSSGFCEETMLITTVSPSEVKWGK